MSTCVALATDPVAMRLSPTTDRYVTMLVNQPIYVGSIFVAVVLAIYVMNNQHFFNQFTLQNLRFITATDSPSLI